MMMITVGNEDDNMNDDDNKNDGYNDGFCQRLHHLFAQDALSITPKLVQCTYVL